VAETTERSVAVKAPKPRLLVVLVLVSTAVRGPR